MELRCRERFAGREEGGGYWAEEMSYPMRLQVLGRVAARSMRKIAVPVPMSAILAFWGGRR